METRTLDTYLSEHEFFRDLTQPDLALIAGCGRNARFAAGAYLAREGDAADMFYVVRAGLLALEIHVPDRGPFVIDTAGPDEIVGISWIFPPHRWQFDVRAVEHARVVELNGACLRDKCEDDPRMGYELMKRFALVLQRRLRSARIRLLDVYGHARTG